LRPKSTVPKEFEFCKRHQQAKPPVIKENPYELSDLQQPPKSNEVTFGKHKWDSTIGKSSKLDNTFGKIKSETTFGKRKSSAPAPATKFIKQK
jgi:hypothetical protein